MEKSENKIQQEIVTWYKNNYCLKHHSPRCLIASVPNGGFRNPFEAMTLKATGLYPGFSDLIVLHKRKYMPSQSAIVIFAEIKTPTGVPSPVQVVFRDHVVMIGFHYAIFKSLEEFQSLIHAL